MRPLALFLSLAAGPLLLAQQVQIGGQPPNVEKDRARAIERAKSVLRAELKLPEAEEMAVQSAKAARWGDASLGCPEEGRMYAQMVTRGWTVVLKARGRTHEVHVAGARAVICQPKQKGTEPPAQP